MTLWPKRPIIYEINTRVWLNELTRKHQRPIELSCVPAGEWDAIAAWGFDAVWLMGVWERSLIGQHIARTTQGYLDDYRRALPDYTLDDVAGSPYCVHRYVVDAHFGGTRGLAAARSELAQRGLKLLLDFVPNHVAPDHPWVINHPEYFVQGSRDDLSRAPNDYFDTYGGHILARGRDPYFPPWPDVAQLNAFNPALRSAAIDTLNVIADQCDGVRCDMAMLMLNDVFDRTWSNRAGTRPNVEYWREVIPAVRGPHPDFLFMAEAYWDMEYTLQQHGFDYCYDKRLYDRLEKETADSVRLHLLADSSYQDKLVRFIENHDEPRAAKAFGPKTRAAALTFAALPGAKLLHDGQLEGRQVKLPVLLGRRPDEPIDLELQTFYRRLLKAINSPAVREGEWQTCDRTGWRDNPSHTNIVAWSWRKENKRCLIVVNLSENKAQAHVRVPWDDLVGHTWRMTDALSGETFERSGDEMRGPGLYVDLLPWGFHFLKF